MNFLSAAHTDTGIIKQGNQDAFCLEVAASPYGRIAMAVLCDGMGGLQKGEVASGSLVARLVNWFEKEMPQAPARDFDIIRKQWTSIISEMNKKLNSYGSVQGLSLGTTLTGLFLTEDSYLAVQVGDSRCYLLSDRKCTQITRDQSLVAKEVELGRLTKEQAKHDRRRNVLLQCVGASSNVNPVFSSGSFKAGDVFVLCSDGFVHELSEEEMCGILSGEVLPNEDVMKKNLIELVELIKERKEPDNITALLIKTV